MTSSLAAGIQITMIRLTSLYTNYTDAYGMSFGGYSNTDYDALADQLVGETDMDKRLDIYKQMEQILFIR